MKCQLELIKKEIAAIIPAAHAEGGEAALLINVEGEKFLDRRSTGWIIKRLAQLYNLDLSAAKKNYGPLLGRKRYIPVPLSTTLIFLPLALRTDIFPLERKLGYISLEQIKATRKEGDSSAVMLKNGLELSCLNTPATIQLRIRDGRLVQKILKSELREEYPSYTSKRSSGTAVTVCDFSPLFYGNGETTPRPCLLGSWPAGRCPFNLKGHKNRLK
jgi:hypothetical protein